MRKVAVPLAKHSPIFGQLASWHTVLRFKSFNKFADNKIKIVYEDSYSGINSALKAGADVIYKVTKNKDIKIYKDFNR